MASIKQEVEHPSPFKEFPSSHSSLECLTPSPHLIVQAVFVGFGDVPPVQRVQVSFVVVVPPVQIYITSIKQEELHPSPFLMLLSSHSSVIYLKPSPHMAWQTGLPLLITLDSPLVHRIVIVTGELTYSGP